VASFAEKPDLATATLYVAEGYLWNSGNFMMPASLALSEMEKYEPAIAEAAKSAVAGIEKTSGVLTLRLESFEAAPRKSFDHAVMEKTDRAVVVEAEFDWHDIGSWEMLSELTGQDDFGNTFVGEVVARDTRNCYVHAVRGRIAVIGADGLVIASTGDDVLVAARAQADGIKDLVAEVNRAESKSTNKNQASIAPWGYHMVVETGPAYQVKRIVVEPGARLSLQRHKHRAEHWVVVSGTADVTIDKETSRLGLNQSTFIPLGAIHRLANPGKDLLTVIEVQYGDYLGEDDIERLSDDYNRGS
jgi:mannose-1-phosphate guanylyltransferase/mannose-6-phosphate isomerase